MSQSLEYPPGPSIRVRIDIGFVFLRVDSDTVMVKREEFDEFVKWYASTVDMLEDIRDKK